MNTMHFQANQRIEIQQAHHDAGITGWDQESIELTLDGDLDQCTARQTEDALVIESHAALALRVPRHIDLHIGQASGDLVLRQLDGAVSTESVHGDLSIHSAAAEITIDRVHGSLTADQLGGSLAIVEADGDMHLHNTARVQLGHIHGAVYAHDINGDLVMGVVEGDVRVQNVTGPITLEAGAGAFSGQSLHGGIDLHGIDGDLSLKTDVTPGLTYRARAKGTILARFPAETSARFQLSAKGLISARLPETEHQEPGRMVGYAGAAEAEIDLQSDSDLTVRIQGLEESGESAWATLDSISSQIEAEIAQHLGEMNLDALAQREIDKALRKAEQELAKMQRRIEQEQRRAQQAAQRAQARAERAAKRAQEKIARKSHNWRTRGGASVSLFAPASTSPRAKARGPTTEEQLAILEMLQQNKITAAEAEDLLAALGA